MNLNIGMIKTLSGLIDKPKSLDKSKLSLTPNCHNATRKSERVKEEPKEQLETHSIEILDDTPPSVKNNEKFTRNLRSATKKSQVKKTAATKNTGRKKKTSATAKVEIVATPAIAINMRKGRIPKTSTFKKKQMPANQKFIDSFFQSCTKTLGVDITSKTAPAKIARNESNEDKSAKNKKTARRGRKRLFLEKCETNQSTTTPIGSKSKTKKTLGEALEINKKELNDSSMEVINLCDLSDTEEEQAKLDMIQLNTTKITKFSDFKTRLSNSPRYQTLPQVRNAADMEPLFCEQNFPSTEDINNIEDDKSSAGSVYCFKVGKPCPPYKVIEGTTFAVDAFRYGQIENVTHYFLTHFHADHYTGLTKKFSMPLYLSPLTARLVREFIGVDDYFLHELELNAPVIVKDIEITAIDANHCPGAVMFVFKLPNGKCILHTGDFRACSEMESEPIFWNNDIDTIYLDTTYMPTQYAFCAQHESIVRAKHIVREFNKRHLSKRVLYVCGSYLIGKEKFWSALAREFRFKVWCEENRRKAITAMQLPELQQLKWVAHDQDADLHVIPIAKLSYPVLQEYFHSFHGRYDVMLAFRPSGWEKNSRPRYNGQINLVGVEYSEHSSFYELERFVKYIKPRHVISTVPVGRNLFETGVVPTRWYQYDTLTGRSQNFQPSISSYLTPMKSCSKVNKGLLPKANFAQDDQENSQKVTPSKSTPMRCIGSSASKHNDMGDAYNDWLH